MGYDWLNWNWLSARHVSALLWARGMLSLGSLALCLAQAILHYPLFWYLHNPSTFCLSCNLLEGGHWLPVQRCIKPFKFHPFVSTQQAGVSFAS